MPKEKINKQRSRSTLPQIYLALSSRQGKFSLINKKAEPKTPHFLSSNQDVVVCSQEQKCGLKYVIHSPGR